LGLLTFPALFAAGSGCAHCTAILKVFFKLAFVLLMNGWSLGNKEVIKFSA